MYSFNSRVRFSEVDENRTLTIPALVDYLQDCVLFQTEELGVGLDHIERVGRRFLLAGWGIDILRLPCFGEKITVSTWATKFKGLFADRDFLMRDASREVLVRANSVWFMYDDATGRPIRIPPEEVEAYKPDLVEGRSLDMEPAAKRIELLGESRAASPILVTQAHIDTNHHVNNAQYLVMALDAMAEVRAAEASAGEGREEQAHAVQAGSTEACETDVTAGQRAHSTERPRTPRRIDAQFRLAAHLGDVIHPTVYRQAGEDGFTVGLTNDAGVAYAIVRVC